MALSRKSRMFSQDVDQAPVQRAPTQRMTGTNPGGERGCGSHLPGKVFDRTVDLDGVPNGYREMNDRQSIKVMIRP